MAAKYKKTRRCTRAEVLEDIDDLAKEIIESVQEIAEQQKYQVLHGLDSESRLRVLSLQDVGSASLRILASPIRWRGVE